MMKQLRVLLYIRLPILGAFTKPSPMCFSEEHDNGIVDTLRYLLCHDNFLKPYSDEYIIVSLLTKAF